MNDNITHIIANGVKYKIIKLLGKGKGGYSFLAEANNKEVVVKQIHHEPCDYYKFGNKIEAERYDYQRLVTANIRIPRLIDIDSENEVIVKEYIDGETISEMIASGKMDERLLQIINEVLLDKASENIVNKSK